MPFESDPNFQEPPFLDLHAAQWVVHDRFEIRPDAHRFENWETYYAGKIGLGVAIEYALQWGIEAIWARVTSLADDLRQQLSRIAGVTVRDVGGRTLRPRVLHCRREQRR